MAAAAAMLRKREENERKTKGMELLSLLLFFLNGKTAIHSTPQSEVRVELDLLLSSLFLLLRVMAGGPLTRRNFIPSSSTAVFHSILLVRLVN